MPSLLGWNILPRYIRRVWLAVCWKALGDTDARAVELAHDHFCSATGTASQHLPREELIISAVHQSGIGSSGSSSVFIKIGQSSSTNFLRRASRSIPIVFFSWVPASTFAGPSSVAQR